jgi:hypothetical protein
VTKAARILLAFVPVAFAALVYHPIADNYFYADDFPNLFLIEDAPVWEYLLKPHGGHILFTRNFVFWTTAKLFGPAPASFFWPVLLTHLLNTWLLFRVIERFTASPLAACFGATLWATSPVHQETLGWYSVFGHVLVGTVLLVILHRAARIAAGEKSLTWPLSFVWLLLALLAATCFGTGIGIAMALPVVAAVLIPPGHGHPVRLAPLLALLVIVPLLYLGLLEAYVALSGQRYPTTGILTSALSLWDRAALMLLRLVGYASSRFPFGFFDLPSSFPGATSTAVVYVFWGSILWLVWRSPAARRPVVACVVLLVAVYGTVAAGRAQYFEGEVAETFLVQQGRYHYVAFMLVGVLLCLVLAEIGSRLRLRPAVGAAALACWLAVAAGAFVRFGPTIDHHDDTRAEVDRVLAEIRRKAEESPPGRPVFITNRYFDPVPAFLIRFEDFPGWAGVFVVFEAQNTIAGRRVYFMQRFPRVRDKLKRGRRMADLIVAPLPGLDSVKGEVNPLRDVLKRAPRRPGKRPEGSVDERSQ